MSRKVFDSRNHARLLGFWDEAPRTWSRNGDTLRVAIAPPLRSLYECPCLKCSEDRMSSTIDIIDFRLLQVPTADGYDRTGVIITDAPLDLLMRLNGFRLPGENPRQAEERRYSRGF